MIQEMMMIKLIKTTDKDKDAEQEWRVKQSGDTKDNKQQKNWT